MLEATARHLAAAGVRVAGILSPGDFDHGRRTRFDLLILDTGERLRLAESDGNGPSDSGRGYRFLPETIAAGRAALAKERINHADVVFIDEVGPLELRGEGWAPALDGVTATRKPMVWVVRPGLVEEVRRRWLLQNAIVLEVSATAPESLAALVRAYTDQAAERR